jgi:hypothetical protein
MMLHHGMMTHSDDMCHDTKPLSLVVFMNLLGPFREFDGVQWGVYNKEGIGHKIHVDLRQLCIGRTLGSVRSVLARG